MVSGYLEKQIGFYAQYHHAPINQVIHCIFVPTIVMTAMVWLNETPAIVSLPESVPFKANGALAAALFYGIYYLWLEPVAGLLYVPFLTMLLVTAHHIFLYVPNPHAVAGALHAVSWVMQFIGHGIEGRKPALFDSISQAFMLAPLFVWLEVLFFFGYNRDLCDRINKNAEKDIAAWKQSTKQKK